MKNKPSVAIPNDLKLINQKTILNVFIEGKKYTINDITETTGISNQTVQKGIQHFVNQNLLVSAGKGEPGHSGGRRPEYFMLSTDLYFLCITMWPQYINCSLFNMQGDILFCSERHFAVMLDFQAEVNAVRDGIERMYSGCNIDKKKIKGASFSVPGTVDQRNNIFRYTSPAPPEWGTDIDLIHYFYDMFSDDIVFLIENVAKMTARTVLLDPELRKKTVFVLFTSWGFPGCFLQRGEIFRGENSLSGEFGHMIVNPQDEE
jgi:hypothetical protein